MTEKPDSLESGLKAKASVLSRHMVSKKPKFQLRREMARSARRHVAISSPPNHIEYAPAFGIQFPKIAKTPVSGHPVHREFRLDSN